MEKPKKHKVEVAKYWDALSYKQKEFVRHLKATNDPREASLLAGYTSEATGSLLVRTNRNIREVLAIQAQGAVDRIERLSIDAENESVRLQANKDIMDRAGYKPVEKVQTTNVNIDLRDTATADLDAIRDKYEAELRAKLATPRHE